MKIVAFLQNQWFRRMGPDDHPAQISRKKILDEQLNGPHRERAIAMYLFMGCKTGARLTLLFGGIQGITWEETSRQYGWDSACIFPADLAHINDVLLKHKPDVVMTFGKHASMALQGVHPRIIRGPHPAARMPDILEQLTAMRAELDRYRMEYSA